MSDGGVPQPHGAIPVAAGAGEQWGAVRSAYDGEGSLGSVRSMTKLTGHLGSKQGCQTAVSGLTERGRGAMAFQQAAHSQVVRRLLA